MPHAALPAVFAAIALDPQEAAFEAVSRAVQTVGPDYPQLFTELRQRFLRL